MWHLHRTMCIWTYPFDFFWLENLVNYNHVFKCMCAWVNYHLPYPLCMASTPEKKQKKTLCLCLENLSLLLKKIARPRPARFHIWIFKKIPCPLGMFKSRYTTNTGLYIGKGYFQYLPTTVVPEWIWQQTVE